MGLAYQHGTQEGASFIERLAALPEADRKRYYEGLTDDAAFRLKFDWSVNARPKQLAPSGDWRYWLVMAGRGFGKTRTGAEWIREGAESRLYSQMAIVGPTWAQAEKIMVDGPSGILRCCPPWNRPRWWSSKQFLEWPGETVDGLPIRCYVYSAEEPDRLRGQNHQRGWADEITAWKYPESWDMFALGMRLPPEPRIVATFTPKPTPLLLGDPQEEIRGLLEKEETILTEGTTYENVANLDAGFYRDILERYEGTRLGDQELLAKLLTDIPNALFKQSVINRNRIKLEDEHRLPRDYALVVVAVDPAGATTESAAETGLCVAALGHNDHLYIFKIDSVKASPREWAREAIGLYEEYGANLIVAERNYGGEMVRSVIESESRFVPVETIHATEGKGLRAEPVALMYERNRVHHVGHFAAGEQQMCQYSPLEKSPGRKDMLDATVHACKKLMKVLERESTIPQLPKVGGFRQNLLSYASEGVRP